MPEHLKTLAPTTYLLAQAPASLAGACAFRTLVAEKLALIAAKLAKFAALLTVVTALLKLTAAKLALTAVKLAAVAEPFYLLP